MDRAIWLTEMIKKNHWKSGVEVGVGSGVTSRKLLTTGIHLTCVDVMDKARILPVDNNLTVWQLTSVEAASLGGFFDFVFIDADHSYESVKADIEAWSPLTNFICGHDYCDKWPGVMKAVDEIYPKAILTQDLCWAVQK